MKLSRETAAISSKRFKLISRINQKPLQIPVDIQDEYSYASIGNRKETI